MIEQTDLAGNFTLPSTHRRALESSAGHKPEK